MVGEDVCKQHPISHPPFAPKMDTMALQRSAPPDPKLEDFMKPSLIPQKTAFFPSNDSIITKNLDSFKRSGILAPISSLRKVFNKLPQSKYNTTTNTTTNAGVQCQYAREDVGVQCNLLMADDVTNKETNRQQAGNNERQQINDAHFQHQQQQQQEHNVFDINIVMDFSRHFSPASIQRSVSDVTVHHSPEMPHQQNTQNSQNSQDYNSQVDKPLQRYTDDNLAFDTSDQGDQKFNDLQSDDCNKPFFFLPNIENDGPVNNDPSPYPPCDSSANRTFEESQLEWKSYKSQTVCLPDISECQTMSSVQSMQCQTMTCQNLSALVPIMEEHPEMQRCSTFPAAASYWSNETIDYLRKTKRMATDTFWEDMTTMVQPGMSRIPRAAGQVPKPPRMTQRRTASAPSKLEQLQAEYQQKLLREKEQKLIEMYERNTQHALQKTNVQNMYRNNNPPSRPSSFGLPPSGANKKAAGSVRDFFNQRRNNENGWVNNNNNNDYWRTQNMRSPGAPRRPMVVPQKGRDKSQPLAPLQQQPNSQPKIEQTRYKPRPPPQPNPQRQRGFIADYDEESSSANSRSRITPTAKDPLPAIPAAAQQNGRMTNFQKWRQDQGKNAQNKNNHIPMDTPDSPKKNDKKMSDFQKWQQEQDQQRSERIKNYNEKQQQQQVKPGSARYTPEQRRKYLQLKNRQGSFTQYTDDEDDEEETRPPKSHRRGSSQAEQEAAEKKKKKELEDMIAKEKAELIQIQKKRQKADQKEAREREQERKRQEAIEERLRKTREAEEEQRRQELEEEKQRQKEASMRQRQAARKPTRVKQKPIPPPPPPDEDDGPVPPKIDNTAFYEQLSAGAGYEKVDLSECSICGRKFATDRLEKHKIICAKSTSKKRKVYDPVKMRTQGTEQEQFVKELKRKPPDKPKPKSDWRKKHEEFMKTMQYNKKLAAVEASGGNLADLPPPPPTENPDYVQCPTCSRKFNATAAERHIPRCKDIKSRPPPPKKR